MFIFDQSVFYCILLFWLIALVLASILLIVSYIFMKPVTETTKMSAYECGFVPLGEIRISYDVHFYRIAILFLIFDLELALFLPWSIITEFSSYDFICGTILLFILTIGFVYEWFKGALTWV